MARPAARRFLASCLVTLGVLVVIAIAAPWLSPYDPLATDTGMFLQPPSAEHWMGTDHLGRDVFSRILYGTRTALIAAFVAVSIGLVAGVGLGLLIGYLGGWWDRIGTRIADVMQSIPALLLALAFLAVVGDGLVNAMIAVGIVFIDSYLRITRALVLQEREMLYVDAGRVAGLTRLKILRRILPNIAGPLVIHTSILLGVALLIEAMLSFVGVGAQADEVSWGAMLEEARQQLYAQPSLALFPGLAITACVLLFNLLGEALTKLLSHRSEPVRRRPARWRKRAGRRGWPGRTAQVTETETPAPEPADTAADTTADATHAPGAVLEIRHLTLVAGRTGRTAPGSATTSLAEAGSNGARPSPIDDTGAGHLTSGPEVVNGSGHAGISGRETELVSNVSITLHRGEISGLVGESGCGKSLTAAAVVGLLPPGVRATSGSVLLDGTDLLQLGEADLRRVRGGRIGMVFQDPMASLSPVHTVGTQLVDTVTAHTSMPKRAATERAAELLAMVGVPDPRRRLPDYPHQFSGGMAQRVMIAAALAGEPEILIADEPTTALDVTIQAQVLDLLIDLTDRLDLSILIITHDMGVAANTCHRVAVMYAGQMVEYGETTSVFEHPRHPYTAALLAAMPESEPGRRELLHTIPGQVPTPGDWPAGCRFQPRCPYATARCEHAAVPLVDGARCVRVSELALEGVR